MRRFARGFAAAVLIGLALAGPVAAHPHTVNGQPIANSQNHPAFQGSLSCESFGPALGGPLGPAWYGLETAHHGPDGGTAGKADGCFLRMSLDANPAID